MADFVHWFEGNPDERVDLVGVRYLHADGILSRNRTVGSYYDHEERRDAIIHGADWFLNLMLDLCLE